MLHGRLRGEEGQAARPHEAGLGLLILNRMVYIVAAKGAWRGVFY